MLVFIVINVEHQFTEQKLKKLKKSKNDLLERINDRKTVKKTNPMIIRIASSIHWLNLQN